MHYLNNKFFDFVHAEKNNLFFLHEVKNNLFSGNNSLYLNETVIHLRIATVVRDPGRLVHLL